MAEGPKVWPVLVYRDARAAATFLEKAFGFEVTAMYPHDDDPDKVLHSELRWPLGGGVMLGTAGVGSDGFETMPAASNAVYVVCEDPDALYERAVNAGAEVLRGLTDQDFGSRDFAVRDPEGVMWSFGTYDGE